DRRTLLVWIPQAGAGFPRHHQLRLQRWCGDTAGPVGRRTKLPLSRARLPRGSRQLHAVPRTIAASRWHKEPAMMNSRSLSICTVLAIALLAGAQTGCSHESAAGTNAEDSHQSANKADLFTVPQDQLQHLQVITLQPTNWPRVLHLSGAVAFN